MKAEDFTRRQQQLSGWSIVVETYRAGDTFYCTVSSEDPARFARARALARRRRTGRARKGRTLARPDASLRPRLTGTWPLKPSQSCAIASIRERVGNSLKSATAWGAGRLDRLDDEQIAGRGRRPRMQLLRYGLGAWCGHSERLLAQTIRAH